jgi:hypothetical protein
MEDPINPSHYTKGAIECIEAIKASMSPEAFKGFLKGNIQKYVWRYEAKGGVESLQKAQWYLSRLIATLEEEGKAKTQSPVGHAPVEGKYDPDGYMSSGCPDGYCAIPAVRQGPPETMFQPVD